jgi:heat shock protein HslJ
MPRCLVAVLALLAAVSAAQARDITGQMMYRERIALAEDAQLVVELRGPGGVVVAEARIETDGRQVPLSFTLVAPDAGDFTLQGAIFTGGQADWLSAVVPVPAGEGALDLGPVALQRFLPLGFTSRMECGGTLVDLSFAGTRARLRAGAETFDLDTVMSGSGARYSDGKTPETILWTKGNWASVTLRGQDLAECQPALPVALLPLTARGNEPGWVLTVTDAGFVYDGDMGARRLEGPLPAPVPSLGGAGFGVSADFSFTLEQSLCRDTMSGMPFPVSVTVTEAGRTLTGCGGQPGDLVAGAWTVEAVDGTVLPATAEVDITFDPASGRVFGSSGCNRYSGGFTLTGEGLSFGAAAGTMMACPDDQMAVEQAFLGGLTTVSRFDIAADGALELYAADRVVIRARR